MTLESPIVSTESGGLGNRIKSWVSAMHINADARVYWPVTANMPARFDELFTNDCALDVVPDDARQHKSWRFEILPEDEPYLPAGFAAVISRVHPIVRGIGKLWWRACGERNDRYRYMLYPKQNSASSARKDGRQIDLEYERIPDHFRRVYSALFTRISIQPAISSTVEDFATGSLGENIVGVQVRTWRDDARRHRKYHVPSRQRLQRLLETTSPSRRFLVVSDSDDVADWVANIVGQDRVVTFPRNTRRDQSWLISDGIVEDLIDMLLLARCENLYASYLSTFSEAAWWFGGARARVSVF